MTYVVGANGSQRPLFHCVYTCPCNKGSDAYEKTYYLVTKAMAGVDANPSLWLRGIPPKDCTYPIVTDIDRQDYV
eukprot:1852554-Pyramimonas_sp.AAC.1